MRKIKEVLRLKHSCGLRDRAIARSCNIARSTVGEYLRRAAAAGLAWPVSEDLDDAQLEAVLFPPPPSIPSEQRPLPDWHQVHLQLKRHKGVTRFLLWQEYKADHPDGYQYSRFCDLYDQWRQCQDPVMRQIHRAGEKLFLDYAGQTMPIVDRRTGEVRQAEIFVAVLGASSYTFCEATWTQALPDWIASHVRALRFFGGLPEVLVPDNLKAGVTSPHLYEPDLNPTYQELADHFLVAVVPARVRRPQDKAKVESGVQVVERQILARLRARTFFSLAELNEAIAELLVQLNEQPFQKLSGSRRSVFEELDRPALRPLPETPYEYAEWRGAKVNIDYHVEVARHYYSVPHGLVGQRCDVRLTDAVVEVYHRSRRVASHRRSGRRGGHTTVHEHMPQAHREHAEWTPERLVRWAATSGEAVAVVVHEILARRPLPQHGFRSCLGVMRLGERYGGDRLEAACRRATATGACSYKSVESILKSGLDRQPLPGNDSAPPPIRHDNIRGACYYAPELPLGEEGDRPC
jgi:transposase